jgi:hypothetical protein
LRGAPVPSKLPDPPITDAEALRAYSGEHLLYELQMFVEAVAFPSLQIARSDEDRCFTTTGPLLMLSTFKEPSWFVRMAAIEALILHFRNLLAFLFPDGAALKPHDVAAHHFIGGSDPLQAWVAARGPMSESLRHAKTRADKELAHLTTKRIGGYAPAKQWPAAGLATELAALFGIFVRHADAERLAPAVVEFVSGLSFKR